MRAVEPSYGAAGAGLESPAAPSTLSALSASVGDKQSLDGEVGTFSQLYGTLAGYCFSINYILGVGVLGVPYVFVRAGYILSPLVLILVTLLALPCAYWIAECVARAEGLKSSSELLAAPVTSQHDRNVIPHHRKYEVNELCGIFIGPRAKVMYEVLIVTYFLGALWSYAAVFAASLAEKVPLPFFDLGGEDCNIDKHPSSACRATYLTYLAFFSVPAVTLTCAELTEQKYLQVFLTVFRFAAMGLMIVTSIDGLYHYNLHSEHAATPPYYSDTPPVDFSGFTALWPVAIYGQIFHHSIPGLIRPVKNKMQVRSMITAVLTTTCVFYSLIGLVVSLYYGSDTNETCSLNWGNYRGKETAGSKFISYLIVLFPPLDIISAFPLNAVTLGNNVMAAFVKDPRKKALRRYVIPFRLLAALPPIGGAMAVSNLDTILKYTGSIGIIIAFIYPCLLQHYSVSLMQAKFGPTGHLTPYSSPFLSSLRLTQVVLAVSVVGFVFVFISSLVSS